MNIKTEFIRIRGLWSADAHAPVTVSDPLKLRRLLGLPIVSDVMRLRAALGLPISNDEIDVPMSTAIHAIKSVAPAMRREVEALFYGGGLLWSDAWENIVVNQGLNDLLGVTLSGTTQDTTWFVGLLSATPTVAAGDTLASHAGWTEVTAYDETNRVAWVDGGESGQSISNSGSPAVFTINANGTSMGGAFLAGVNTGTGGRLYAAGAFSAGNKDLDDNDTLTVTATFTTAAA